jgi:hypothetical protein
VRLRGFIIAFDAVRRQQVAPWPIPPEAQWSGVDGWREAERHMPGTCHRRVAGKGHPMRHPSVLGSGRARLLALALACLPVTPGALAQAADVHGLGRVREDGSLLVADTVVHLTGIYIPSLRRECRTTGCMPQAVRTLRRKVGGFVHCAIAAERGDGSLEGFCSTAGRGVLDPRTDLGAWLIEQGFGLAAIPFILGS